MSWNLYNWLFLPVFRIGFQIMGLIDAKTRQGIEGRRNWQEHFKAQMKLLPAGKRIWFHATSVGEFLQARPVMDLIKAKYPECNLLMTFYSPSVDGLVQQYDKPAIKGYLPVDTSDNMRKLLNILRPSLIIFSKFDVWPNLVQGASDRRIPTALIDGTLSENSGRLKFPAKNLFMEVFRKIKLIGAISDSDRERFVSLGVDEEKIEVTGDTRYDQTFSRATSVLDTDPLFEPFDGIDDFIVVAGSSWPDDEKVILPAFKELIKWEPHSKLILVPHEPTEEHVAKLEKKIRSLGMYTTTLTGIEQGNPVRDANVIIVDRVGVLAKLYKLGSVAVVGGSWRANVHNVMEPAAFGIPVIIGPKHKNSHEALLMLGHGGAFQAKHSGELAELLLRFARDPESRTSAGEIAKKVVMDNIGATDRTLTALTCAFPEIFSSKNETAA